MVRGSSLIAALPALLAGCDLVFDVSAESTPCDLAAFDEDNAIDVSPAEDFSFDWQQTFGVVMIETSTFEIDPVTSELTQIDIGAYMSRGLALTPEGDALFFTAVVEPPELKGMLRGDEGVWVVAPAVPRGTYAGTPSADVFGPRRVMVKLRDGTDEVQEYEDVSGRWMPVSGVLSIATARAPNLTPDGLTMVYPGTTTVGEPAVFAAQRASTAEPFGEVTQILPGAFAGVQLVAQCQRLYATDGLMLRRYDQ